MEFVAGSEVATVLEDLGISADPPEDECVRHRMTGDEVVRLHVGDGSAGVEPFEGASQHDAKPEALPGLFEGILQGLHLDQIVLFPHGKWRDIFDAVAFSLAENEDWQAVDAAATVALNTRDPLLCGPADFALVLDLIRALLSDAEAPGAALTMIPTATPVLVEVRPPGVMRIACGTQVIADELQSIVAGG